MKRKSYFIGLVALAVSLMMVTEASARKAYWYEDNDGDGFGSDVYRRVNPRRPPVGYVPVSGDCNDIDTSIYPDAPEVVADGVDQNCDAVDSCYEDFDGDTYGGTIVITGSDLTCVNTGESTDDLDCDDTDPAINPGMVETGELGELIDQIDQNCDGEVGPNFLDPQLESCVRFNVQHAGGSYDNPLDIVSLTGLGCQGFLIHDLTGMEYFSENLQSFTISPHVPCMGYDCPDRLSEITDLSPLADLVGLTKLHFDSTPLLIDLSKLKNLVNLELLLCRGCSSLDIGTLPPELQNLTAVNLNWSSFTGISDMPSLQNLTKLSLTACSLTDVSGLPFLPNLMYLYLSRNDISDLGQFSLLSEDFTSLSDKLPSLLHLKLNMNIVSDLDSSAFTNFDTLISVDLTNNYITDLSPWAPPTDPMELPPLPASLSRIFLSQNCITDYSPFTIDPDVIHPLGGYPRLHIEELGYYGPGVIGWELNYQQHCLGPVPVPTVTSAGQVWMAHNLGAARVATSWDDAYGFGDLYQWGRGADRHQSRTSGFYDLLSETKVAPHPYFIYGSSDWLVTRDDSLWQGGLEDNNPCPDGFRLPTESEWNMEQWSWISHGGSISVEDSPLKLVGAGSREWYSADVLEDNAGVYWSSTVVYNGFAKHLYINHSGGMFYPGFNAVLSGHRAMGASVRCIQD